MCVSANLLVQLLETQTSRLYIQQLRGGMSQPRDQDLAVRSVVGAAGPDAQPEGKARCTVSLCLAGSQLAQRHASQPKGLGTAQPSPRARLRSKQSLSPCAQTCPAARHDRRA